MQQHIKSQLLCQLSYAPAADNHVKTIFDYTIASRDFPKLGRNLTSVVERVETEQSLHGEVSRQKKINGVKRIARKINVAGKECFKHGIGAMGRF